MTDSFICQQVVAGNPGAFRLLVLRHQRPLFKFLAGFRFPAQTGEDLAQEAFVRAFRSLASFDAERAEFQTWLFTIARNLALSELERAKRRRERALEDASAVAAPEESARHDRARDLTRAMERLPTDFRSALALSCFQELSLETVAGIEGCSVGTIKSRVFRAKAMLRTLLRGEEGEPG